MKYVCLSIICTLGVAHYLDHLPNPAPLSAPPAAVLMEAKQRAAEQEVEQLEAIYADPDFDLMAGIVYEPAE